MINARQIELPESLRQLLREKMHLSGHTTVVRLTQTAPTKKGQRAWAGSDTPMEKILPSHTAYSQLRRALESKNDTLIEPLFGPAQW